MCAIVQQGTWTCGRHCSHRQHRSRLSHSGDSGSAGPSPLSDWGRHRLRRVRAHPAAAATWERSTFKRKTPDNEPYEAFRLRRVVWDGGGHSGRPRPASGIRRASRRRLRETRFARKARITLTISLPLRRPLCARALRRHSATRRPGVLAGGEQADAQKRAMGSCSASTNHQARHRPQMCGSRLLLRATRAPEQQPGQRSPLGEKQERVDVADGG